jgi:hypothetical protein
MRLARGVAAMLLACASASWADMSVGRTTAAYDGPGDIPTGNPAALATVTITKVRRHTVFLVNATVTDIPAGVDADAYLAIDGVLSGPVTRCRSTVGTCSLSFHRPVDADERAIGMPITFTLLGFSWNQPAPTVQVDFSVNVVKK